MRSKIFRKHAYYIYDLTNGVLRLLNLVIRILTPKEERKNNVVMVGERHC